MFLIHSKLTWKEFQVTIIFPSLLFFLFCCCCYCCLVLFGGGFTGLMGSHCLYSLQWSQSESTSCNEWLKKVFCFGWEYVACEASHAWVRFHGGEDIFENFKHGFWRPPSERCLWSWTREPTSVPTEGTRDAGATVELFLLTACCHASSTSSPSLYFLCPLLNKLTWNLPSSIQFPFIKLLILV